MNKNCLNVGDTLRIDEILYKIEFVDGSESNFDVGILKITKDYRPK